MKKMKLNLDDLKVESFSTTNQINKRGTIYGQVTDFAFCDTHCYTDEGVTCDPNCTAVQCNPSELPCQYPTLPQSYTCDGSPGCGPSEFTCGGNTCAASCMSCQGGICK